MEKNPSPMNFQGSTAKEWKLSDHIYGQLYEFITSGEIAENAKLPSEADLAERFDVSRPIIREALAKLRDEGIIYSRRGSGSFVMQKPQHASLRFAPIASIADIQKCFEFRAEIEGAAAKLAAIHRDDESLKEIKNALDALQKHDEMTGSLRVLADTRFHLAICKATKNSFFILLYESMQSHIDFSINLGMNLARNQSLVRSVAPPKHFQNEHVTIYEAIRDRDPERAQAAMVTHIKNAERRVFQGTEEE